MIARGILSCVVCVMLAGPAAADTVRLTGSTIPLRDCTIEDIRAGRVYFAGRRGRRQWREEEEVAALGFAGLPELDEAERRLEREGFDAAWPQFVAALLATRNDVERVWVHARLARLHDAAGHSALAAAHAAHVYMIREDRAWRRLEPRCPPAVSSPAAGREAWRTLREAERSVRAPALRRAIRDMATTLATVEPVPADLGRGAPTISGLSPDDPRLRGQATPPPETAPRGRTSIDAIDELVAAERYRDALAALAVLSEDPDDATLDRLLLASGRSLRGVGRGRDAAVMFTQCAILYAGSSSAGWGWYETALVYRDVIQDEATTQRLLRRAGHVAAQTGDRRLAESVEAAIVAGEDATGRAGPGN